MKQYLYLGDTPNDIAFAESAANLARESGAGLDCNQTDPAYIADSTLLWLREAVAP